jgi:hypothetical protein
MSTRDRRSQRIRDQIRAHANPRSGQPAPRTLQEQLKRQYLGETATSVPSEVFSVTAELARIARRRR